MRSFIVLIVAFLISGCDRRAPFEPIDRSWHTGTVTVEPYRSGKERGVKVNGNWPDAPQDLWIRHSLWLTQEGGQDAFLSASEQQLANFRNQGTSSYTGGEDYRRHIDRSRPYRAVFDYELWKGRPGKGKLLKKDSVFSEPVDESAEGPDAGRDKESAEPISKEKAKAIAKKHLGLPSEGGCYVEERGDYYFVAPPYILKADLERAGVYIDKATGEPLEERPAE
jgi:hypothetical protein